MITPSSSDLRYTIFLKPSYSWPVIHLVFFFSHFRLGVLHITLQIRKAQPRGWNKEQTSEHRLGSAPSAKKKREGESLCDTFVQLFVHLLTIVGVYFAWNFYKATRNANSSLAVFSHWLLLPTDLPLNC